MLKILTIAVFGLTLSFAAGAKDVYVNSYVKKDGSYVPSHFRTAPNSTKTDNYSTKGNYNPYTGKAGTKSDDYSTDSTNDSSTDQSND